jgi:citrate lyase subunit beta/citryl-CoA lyase
VLQATIFVDVPIPILMSHQAFAGNRGEGVRSDCFVELEIRSRGGIQIDLQSKVETIFGNQIRTQVSAVLKELVVEHARIQIEDSGSLPFVIAARVEAAVRSAGFTERFALPEMIPSNRAGTRSDRYRVSRLYLPGNSPHLMLNAGIHKPDGIIMDLEDSVAPEKKAEARILVRNALRQVDFYGAERMVRINQLPAGLEDLKEVVPHHVHVVLIPKCEQASEVVQVAEGIRSILQDAGPEREVFLMPILETALGIENAFQIATAADTVVAMAIGLEDYTADLGVRRTDAGGESLYARTRMVNACKAAGIQPIDSVFSDIEHMDALLEHAKQSRALGFEGMGCIHPRQIRVIHEGFQPDQEEIDKATHIVAAFREAEAKGLGVTTVGSKMVDPPVVKRAMRTLEIAERSNSEGS